MKNLKTGQKANKTMTLTMVIIILFLNSCVSAANWNLLGENSLKSSQTNVAFISESIGFTGGYAGAVHYTNDGGKNWIPAETKTLCRYTIDVTKDGKYIHAGNGGNVGISTDQGKTWELMEKTIKSSIGLISFSDENTGFALTKSKEEIFVTNDGGSSWTEIVKPDSKGSHFLAMESLSYGELYLFDKNGVLHYTADNGKTWNSKTVLSNKYNIKTTMYDTNSVSIRFSDKNIGTIAIISPSSNKDEKGVVILQSENGFKTISDRSIKNDKVSISSKVFLSSDSKYLTVNNGKIFTLYSQI